MENKTPRLHLIFLVSICLIAFFPSLNNGFLLDDFKFLGQNAYTHYSLADHFTRPDHQHYYPLYTLLNKTLLDSFGGRPFVIRFVSLLIYLGNVLVFYIFCRLLLKHRNVALLAALLFGLHPVNADLLNHITVNAIMLGSLLCLVSFVWCWTYFGDRNKRSFYLGALFVYLLSLWCHESFLLFPFFLFCLLFFAQKKKAAASFTASLPFLLLACFHFFVWRIVAGGNTQLLGKIHDLHLSVPEVVANYAQLMKWYVGSLFWPHDVVFIHNITPVSGKTAIPNLILLGFVVLVTFWLIYIWKKDVKSFALMWFWGGSLIVVPASFAHAYMGLVIEPNWLFFPSIGMVLLCTALVKEFSQRFPLKIVWRALAGIVVAAFFIASQYYVAVGQTPGRYSEHWLRRHPDNFIALMTRAEYLAKNKMYDRALEYYYRAKKASLYPSVKNYFNIGVILAEQGHLQEAKIYLHKARKLDPSFAHTYNTLGTIASKENELSQAQQYFRKALELNPDLTASILNLADLYLLNGQDESAMRAYEDFLARSSVAKEKVPVQMQLLRLYLTHGHTQKALALADRVVEAAQRPETFLRLAAILSEHGLNAGALVVLDEAIKRYSDNKEPYLMAGVLLANQGHIKEGIAIWQEGQALDRTDKRFKEYIKEAQRLLNAQQ